jgi:hypothetical protein
MKQQQTTETMNSYHFYEKTHRLKSMQSMDEKNKQRKSIEEESKQHGTINTDDLFEERVISNKNCFWSLLQSQTDRMHYFFHQEEKYIKDNLTGFERTGLLTPALLERIRKDMLWLQDFVTFNIRRFEEAVSEFDGEHNCDTFEDEMGYFEETYPFTNRERLTLILEAIDQFTDVDNLKQKYHFQNSLSGDECMKSVNKKKRSFRRFVSMFILRLLD